MILRLPVGSEWRREALRTNLWLVPMIEVIAAIVRYVVTRVIDRAAYHQPLSLPSWLTFGSADPSRQILATLAAAVITVVGVVFSITIVTLTLASTQFGPRMLRNFIRDRGTQSELLRRMGEGGGTVLAPSSGYLQFVRHRTLIGLAIERGAVIRLLHRPGHSSWGVIRWRLCGPPTQQTL